jgi:hypothetical protein
LKRYSKANLIRPKYYAAIAIEATQPLLKISRSSTKSSMLQKGQRKADKIYHVQNVNNMDKRLRAFMQLFNGVATKYLQNYLHWLLVLEKIKHSTKRMATVTTIALTSNTAWFEYKQQAFNMLFRT